MINKIIFNSIYVFCKYVFFVGVIALNYEIIIEWINQRIGDVLTKKIPQAS